MGSDQATAVRMQVQPCAFGKFEKPLSLHLTARCPPPT